MRFKFKLLVGGDKIHYHHQDRKDIAEYIGKKTEYDFQLCFQSKGRFMSEYEYISLQ